MEQVTNQNSHAHVYGCPADWMYVVTVYMHRIFNYTNTNICCENNFSLMGVKQHLHCEGLHPVAFHTLIVQ